MGVGCGAARARGGPQPGFRRGAGPWAQLERSDRCPCAPRAAARSDDLHAVAVAGPQREPVGHALRDVGHRDGRVDGEELSSTPVPGPAPRDWRHLGGRVAQHDLYVLAALLGRGPVVRPFARPPAGLVLRPFRKIAEDQYERDLPGKCRRLLNACWYPSADWGVNVEVGPLPGDVWPEDYQVGPDNLRAKTSIWPVGT